jgi:glycosyltransferase involved in cell wall biosynthesis
MKIAINASFLRKQNTGIGQVSTNFLEKLAEISSSKILIPKQNLDEFFLYLEEDVEMDLPKNFHKVVFLPRWKRDDLIRKIWWEMFSLPTMVKKDQCEILFSLYQCPTVLGGGLPGKNAIKHVMLVHDIIPRLFPEYLNNWRKKLYQKLSERAIKKADKLVTVSHRSEKDLIQHLGIDPKKISVSHIDVAKIYKREVSASESQRVLKKYNLEKGYLYTGGGLEVRKNTEGVLRAYKILLEAYGHASWLPKLVISGRLLPELAPLVTDVEALVAGLGLEKEVKILGFVNQADCPALYANAKVFVRPSFYEGFGLPELEAMSQGTPVVTSKNSSLPEVGSDAVLYCNPHDVDDLAMVLKNLLTNERLQAALSLKGRERSGHFSWNKFTEKIINILHEHKF